MKEPQKTCNADILHEDPASQYQHYTVIAKGIVGELASGFYCPKGIAFMGMKVWAESRQHAHEIIRETVPGIGFTVTDKIEIFKTKSSQPVKDYPSWYDVQFTPFNTAQMRYNMNDLD
jgi:hypothetical protein